MANELDEGTDHFQPSNLQITTIDVGNQATNVIPAKATAAFNCRFNDLHGSADIERWVRTRLDRDGAAYPHDGRIVAQLVQQRRLFYSLT